MTAQLMSTKVKDIFGEIFPTTIDIYETDITQRQRFEDWFNLNKLLISVITGVSMEDLELTHEPSKSREDNILLAQYFAHAQTAYDAYKLRLSGLK